MVVDKHEKLSNFALMHKLIYRNCVFIVVLHLPLRIGSVNDEYKSYPKMSVKRLPNPPTFS